MALIDISAMYDAPLDPAAMVFTTRPGKDCRQCIFNRQRVAVCNRAVEVATRAGMPSCDDSPVVYAHRELDARQPCLDDQAAGIGWSAAS